MVIIMLIHFFIAIPETVEWLFANFEQNLVVGWTRIEANI